MISSLSALEIREPFPSFVVIRLIRPREKNPLSVATLDELNTTLGSLLPRSDVQTIIFTGSDDVFASGANIRELTELTPISAKEFAEAGQRLFHSIATARQKTIAAINGFCMGGGLDLALACDVRFASPTAKFAHPGARLGIITGWGGTQRVPRLIGRARALELFTTARMFDAEEALTMGLVDAIADPVLERALMKSVAHS